jgi:nitroimidazol reductase NimA-like FMN-containing flavoprotein (pyridoxamine 5'-phosphate oxidase superfamily)
VTMNAYPESWWIADRRRNVQVLDSDECLQLLAGRRVGRLSFCTRAGPRIVPMNYALAGNVLLFRTGYDTEAASHVLGHPVAFEVDDVDEFLQAGWSVVVSGEAQLIPPGTLRLLDLPQFPQPWAAGDRSMVLQLSLSDVTGRRVHPV